MSAIQNGANWWVDGFARYSGGTVGRSVRSGVMNATAVQNPALWGSDASDSMTSVISDIEEQGEVGQPHEETHATSSHLDTLSQELQAGLTDLSVADEIVAATAKRIGVIEAIMRDHRSGGLGKFDDEETDESEEPGDDSFAAALASDTLQDPSLTMATTIASTDRMGIFSLLV